MNSENIKEITEDVVRNSGYFLIDFNLRGHGRNQVIEVYIDGRQYINANDCAKVSHELDNKLQEIVGLEETYRLDVSSPGIDRPLKFIEQFPKHLNKKFELIYKLNDEEKKSEAELMNVQNDELTFQTNDKKEFILKFSNIIKAKVFLSFS
jgi:ribosome maturation factor RimP